MRAVKYPPPVEVTITFVPLPASRIVQTALGFAGMIRMGGSAEHHLVADALVSAGRIAAHALLDQAGDSHAR